MNKHILLSFLFAQITFIILLPVWIELTNYLHPIVMSVVWFLITFLFVFFVCWVKKIKIRISKRILNIVIVLYALGLFILLFFRPGGSSYGSVNLIPLNTITYYLTGNVDFLIALYNLGANIGLFIPFGLYYRSVRKAASMKHLLLISLCTISVIEGLQFITKRGSLDIDDLILNVLGVCLGYFLYPVFRKVLVFN